MTLLQYSNMFSCNSCLHVKVGATDVDQGRYGSITFSIVDGSYGMFAIDNITGWINTTSELDREGKDSYILIVRASDGKEGST